MADPQDFLFVYGTLRSDTFSDSHRQLISPNFSLVSRATIAGRLYVIVDYPGFVEAVEATDLIIGEVYAFEGDESKLADIDDYEGCGENSPTPHLFTRVRQKAWLRDGSVIEAWVYQYNFQVHDSMLIRSGDFLDPF